MPKIDPPYRVFPINILQIQPTNFFNPNSFFCDLKPHAKFRNPTITPSGRKVTVGEEREKSKNGVNSGHLVP
jgi:hypothetical protein